MLSEKSKLNRKSSINAIASRLSIGNQLNRFGPPTQLKRHRKINLTAPVSSSLLRRLLRLLFPFLSASAVRITTKHNWGISCLLLAFTWVILLGLIWHFLLETIDDYVDDASDDDNEKHDDDMVDSDGKSEGSEDEFY